MASFVEFAKRTVDPLIEGIDVIDVDTHYSEPHDLWTSRAPSALKEKVPQIRELNGELHWVIDGDKKLNFGATANSTIRPDGTRSKGMEFMNHLIKDVHPSSWDVAERVKMMDAHNIKAQIVYPNVLGFGGQSNAQVDPAIRLLSTQIYNDAMLDIQEQSGNRIYPMLLLPWWEPKLAIEEIKRGAARGARGVNMNTDPQNYPGLPDLGDPHWNPVWEACVEYDLPVNFHIGASEEANSWAGEFPWKSLSLNSRVVVGGTMLFVGNGRVMANLIMSGILDRFPELQFVSVESGVGWIPFVLEALEHQIVGSFEKRELKLMPSEYFDRNFYGCFWFETKNLAQNVRSIGVDRVMFETDFPHPTCVFPEGPDYVKKGLADLTWEERNKVLSLNAKELYRLC